MHGQTHKALSYCHVDSSGTYSKRPTMYSVGTNLHLGSNCNPSCRYIDLRFLGFFFCSEFAVSAILYQVAWFFCYLNFRIITCSVATLHFRDYS